ncbi:hypothetical protein EVAR_88596_1 [Eumeta japonica]|uniref:Uncharacterized protein n=1 Tax=Eumeta variegata TaxID=151549 RepID=A0A4C1Y698_EUMVA|nr:hypothetical protein EVAR_88596_1 [Eumeta japonica]
MSKISGNMKPLPPKFKSMNKERSTIIKQHSRPSVFLEAIDRPTLHPIAGHADPLLIHERATSVVDFIVPFSRHCEGSRSVRLPARPPRKHSRRTWGKLFVQPNTDFSDHVGVL